MCPMTASAVSTPISLAERARLFHALSDETRLAILGMLRGGECCVCDLQDALDAAQSRLSFHLKVLRDAGLVRDRKEGRWSFYTLNPERLEAAAASALDYSRLAARRTATGRAAKLHQISSVGPHERPTSPAPANARLPEAPGACCS